MKSLKNLSMIVIAALAIAACKKEKTETPSVVGTWEGKYSNTVDEYPSHGCTILFRNNGTLRIYDGLDTALVPHSDGTYTITGSSLNAQYSVSSSFEQWLAFDVNAKFTFMEGTWGNEGTTTPGGRLFLSKQ